MSISKIKENIAQIVFKVSSDKGTVRLNGFDESIEDYRNQLDIEQAYMTHITVKVFAVDENGEKVMDIAFLSAIYFETEELFGDELTFPALCDMVSSDACEMAEAVTDQRGRMNPTICRPEHNMLYIKKLYVEETCRGFGAGRYLLDNINELMRHSLGLRFHACTVMPYPQIKTRLGYIERATENADENLPRLISFYEKAGFVKTDDSECMYKKCTDILDELFASMHDE